MESQQIANAKGYAVNIPGLNHHINYAYSFKIIRLDRHIRDFVIHLSL